MLIRAKDITSNGIACSFKSQFPDNQSSFDQTITVTLTKKQTNAVKSDPDKYRFIPKTSTFDFVDLHHHWFYEMKLRIVRFPIADGSYESIITNLPPEQFTPEDIKVLYHMRWGIETSFRELKYALGLTRFHSKK